MKMDLIYIRDESRAATFHIATEWLFDSRVRAFLGQCVIVRAERSFCLGDTVLYEAFHPDLPPCSMVQGWPTKWVSIGSDGRIRFCDDRSTLPDGCVELWSRPVV